MRVSLHTEKAVKTLDFIKGLELPTGGIRGWGGSPPYPEVSGYLIPTLMDYGELDLAFRLANWLVSIQNDDGSFEDMLGQKRTFDTAAVMEGLEKIGYYKEALSARRWLAGQTRSDGAVKVIPENDETHLYTMRVSGLLGNYKGALYWKSHDWEDSREHYIAYALEGLWRIGEEEFVKDKLRSRDWSSNDTVANAQMAILHHQADLNYIHFVSLVENNLHLMNDSWTAKWILDMWKVIGD